MSYNVMMENYFSFIVMLTNNCNLFCKHCCNNSFNGSEESISKEAIFKFIDSVEHLKPKNLNFTGGEILTRDDFVEILDYAYKRGIPSAFFTNGILVTEEFAASIANKVEKVIVSIDGDKDYHDYLRNKVGVYEKAITAINIFIKNNIPTAIQMTVTKENFNQIENIIDIASDLQVDQILFAPLENAGRGNAISTSMLSIDQINDLYRLIVNKRGKHPNLQISMKGYYNSSFVKEHPCNIYACNGTSCHNFSPNVPRKIVVNFNGDVYLMSSDISKEFILGNIYEDNIGSILDDYNNNATIKKFRKLCNYVYFKIVKDYPNYLLPWFNIVNKESHDNSYITFSEVLERSVEYDVHALDKLLGREHIHHGHTHSHDGHVHTHLHHEHIHIG